VEEVWVQKTSECAEEVAEEYVEAEYDKGACRGREHAEVESTQR